MWVNGLAFYMVLSLSEAIVLPPASEQAGKCGLLKTTVSEEDNCLIKDALQICPNSSAPTTKLVKKCRFPYQSAEQGNAIYKCSEQGEWTPSYDLCQPDCGVGTSKNKYPWLVGIYDSEEKLICPGTIISPYHVVTAAQCIKLDIVDFDGTYKADPKEYTIIAGKHYSNIRRTRSSQQNRMVKEIIRHEDYRDWSTAKEQDIVLIEVEEEFAFFDDVRPACIDWQSLYEELDLKDGNDGIAVGWGYDKDEVVPCEASSVQYWQKNICWENLPNHFRKQYFGIDKFCSRYVNDVSPCGKEIGTGLFFKSNRQKYFLRGITSIFNADSKSYVLYTKMSNYLEWLKLHMAKNERISPFFETYGKDVWKINSTEGCVLPQHVPYGKFSLTTGNTYPESTWVPSPTVIILSCEDTNSGTTSFRCLNSEWSPAIEQAICKKPGTCASLKTSESEEVHCKVNGSPQSNCMEPPTNTTAVLVCAPYYSFSGQQPVYKCQNGKWDPPFRPCNVECGTKRVDVTTLAIGGKEALRNEYPWVVAIYEKNNQVCGGTLISRYYVLSAAHCFTATKGERKRIEDYTIIAGKYYRDININDSGSQTRQIKTLHIHEDFKGSLLKYRDDIALVELDHKLSVSFEVQPVCIDWQGTYEDIDFTTGKLGVVAGWGFTSQAGLPSDVLKKLNVPFQPKDVCLKHLPEDFSYSFLATDKVCAGYKDNNTNVCKGDSGGGLYFRSDGTRYYLRGIVSLTVKSQIGCDTNQFALYTKVSKYLTWIKDITRNIL